MSDRPRLRVVRPGDPDATAAGLQIRDVWRDNPRASRICVAAYAAGVVLICCSLLVRAWPAWLMLAAGAVISTASGVWWLAACWRMTVRKARE